MKTSDFDRIGKKLPYTAPLNFMEEMQENVWKEINRQPSGKPETKKRTRTLRIALVSAISTAACIALVFAGYLTFFHKNVYQDNQLCMEQAFYKMSSQDQKELIRIYQADPFLLTDGE